MELYNFYSEQVYKSDVDKIKELKDLYSELKFVFAEDCIVLIERKNTMSIIGQVRGEDTNLGDLDLLTLFNTTGI